MRFAEYERRLGMTTRGRGRWAAASRDGLSPRRAAPLTLSLSRFSVTDIAQADMAIARLAATSQLIQYIDMVLAEWRAAIDIR